MIVSRIQLDQINAVEAHLKRHILESGKHGVHWLPYDPKTWTSPMRVPVHALNMASTEVRWQRWFVVTNEASEVVGHLSIKGARFDRGLHRCELGMGLEFPYWRKGLGTQLLDLAIEEARSLSNVEYLDLRVISLNTPGINLYEKHGFSEVSRIEDFCRIDGQPVADILMTISV